VDLVRLIAFNVKIGREEANRDVQCLAGYLVPMYLKSGQYPVLSNTLDKPAPTNCLNSRCTGMSPRGLGLRLSCRQ
jgi:hypothetical protein